MATQETIKQMRVSENGPLRDLEDTTARAGVSELQTALASLQSALDTLMGTDDITDEIDTYNEIKDFLDGFDVNDPTLSSQLALLNSQVNDLTTAIQNKANTSALNTAVSNLQALINGKVDAVTGKGLSTNDYTDAEKTKLAGIAAGAQVNVINGIKAHGASTNLPVTNGVVELPEQTEVDLSDYYDKDEVDAKVADAGKVKSVTINGTKKTPNETTGDVDLGTVVGEKGDKGDKGDQGNSGVASADGIESVNNLNGGTTDTSSKVYVLGANMGKELADKMLVDGQELSINDATTVNLYYIKSNNTWWSYTDVTAKKFAITPGKSYKVTAGSDGDSYIAVLSADNHTESAPAFATGMEGRIQISSGQSYSFVAPEDGLVLYFWQSTYLNANYPQKIAEVAYIGEMFVQRCEAIEDRIDDVESHSETLETKMQTDGDELFLSNAASVAYYFINPSGLWASYTDVSGKSFSLTQGKKYKVYAGTGNTYIALLKTVNYTESNPDYANGTTGRIALAAGESYTFTAQESTMYLYVWESSYLSSSFPSKIAEVALIGDVFEEKMAAVDQGLASVGNITDILDITDETVVLRFGDLPIFNNGTIAQDGTVNTADATWRYSDFLRVKAGSVVTWNSANYGYLAIYSSPSEAGFIESKANSASDQTYTVPADGRKYYIRYTAYDIEGRRLSYTREVGSTIEGVKAFLPPIRIAGKWQSIGTSITWYNNNVNQSFTKGYQDRVMEVLRFSDFSNIGISGGSMVGFATSSLNTIVAADYYTIEHGINDWGQSQPVGTINDFINDTGASTFYGAYRKVIDAIYTANPDATIIICTPRKGYGFSGALPDHWYDAKNEKYLKDYADAAIEIAKFLSLPICDWFNECGTNQYNLADDSIDVALHPNDNGYQKMANLLILTFKKALGLW